MRFTRAFMALALVALVAAAPAHGLGLLDKAKKKVQDKVDKKTEKAIDKATEDSESKKAEEATPAQAAPAEEADQLKPGQGAWANYDFKPGSRILFADDFTKDEVGDFPRRFELVEGTMEIVEWQQARWLRLTTTSKFIVPLPEVMPERYTMEFDFTVPGGVMWIYTDAAMVGGYMIFGNGGTAGVAGKGPQAQSQPNPDLLDKVVRARVMTDGRYVKLYVNDKRLANIPNFDPARTNKILFWVDAHEAKPALFGNFRIAAGGKKLYEALAEKGRVATQGIYFDIGSDRIRPESTPTLKEIGGMLTDHADLKLLIEGHTDNVGAPAANQALSDKRAAAVRQALIESFSVEGSRLTVKGLGATKPAGPNDTPEGRQNNRRVELVKL